MRLTRRHALKRLGAIGISPLVPGCERRLASSDASVGKARAAEGALRLELRHHVSQSGEAFSVTRLCAEPQWAGPLKLGASLPDWGDYRLSVFEAETDKLIYRSGFDSTLDTHTPSVSRLSVRFPIASTRVRAVIEKRRAMDLFTPLWSAQIDPTQSDIERSAPSPSTRVHAIVFNGDPHTRVDIVILGDGYQASEEAKFVDDAKRAAGYLFAVEPFKSRSRNFNVRAVFTPSADSGVTDRYLGVNKNTAFDCTYYDGTHERTLAPRNEHALRGAACAVAYDFILVLANAQRYGGSATFGGAATIAIDSAAARYLVVHEFAHVIGGLADEYYLPSASGPAYTGNIEPWQPNVTLSAKHAKWTVPHEGATRWNKAEYDRYFANYVRRYLALRGARADERTIEQLMKTEARRLAAILSKHKQRREVGLFAGAHGYASGVYRSEVDCIMFSLQNDYFCSACSRAINRMIAAHCV